MMISSENAGNVTTESKFPCPVSLSCLGRQRCSGIIGKLKENRKFKCRSKSASRPYKRVFQKYKIKQPVFSEGALGNVITRTRGGWRKFRDSVPLLASRGLRAKGGLYSACVHSVMVYGSQTCPDEDEYAIRLKRLTKDVKN